MGSCHSKNSVPDSASVSSAHRKSNGASPNPPQTRARLDSWANPPTPLPENSAQLVSNRRNPHDHHLPSETPPHNTPRSMLENQWKRLWETHSPHLVDPVDVSSVLDMLLDKTINQLSAVQITWLQRKVRAAYAALPNSGGSKAVLAKIVNTSAGNGQVVSDAKSIAEKMRLLHPSIWMRVIPVAAWCPSFHMVHNKPTPAPRRNSSNQNLNGSSSNLNIQNLSAINGLSDSDNYAWSDLVLRNLELILLHLSSSDWERVALAASHAADAAGLEMDVNKRETGWAMPRPSVVPEITDPAIPPPGVTFQALAAIIAMAIEGSRSQRLQLLFYLLLSDLREFLTLHPAGGAPVWLLECENNTVVSLASLTHYHYFGTAFLPVPTATKTRRKHNFVSSHSRKPLKVAVKNLHTFLLDIVQNPSEKPAFAEQEASRPEVESVGVQSKLQDRLSITVPEMHTEDIRKSSAKLEKSIASYASDPRAKTHWTLQEFDEWLDHSLDDTLLELVMHRIFAAGILPSHVDEARWVAAEWALWLQYQQPLFEQKIESVNDDAIEYTLGEEGGSVLSIARDRNPCENFYSQVWGGIGGLDCGGSTGHGILYCIDQAWWNAWCAYVAWSWSGDRPARRTSLRRPRSLSNARLVERTDDDGAYIAGALGSFEMMKSGMVKGKDYILVPPGVWNVLYELYGGGPPLPRAIRLLTTEGTDVIEKDATNQEHFYSGGEVEHNESLGRSDSNIVKRVPRLPELVSVASYPWVVNVQLCDPTQPYRRGDVGLTSIHVMVTPEEPLWRLFSEIISRFTLDSFKAFGQDGTGRARLWKRTDHTDTKPAMSRYGPWNLLCKSRYAAIPNTAIQFDMNWFVSDWREYTDDSTVQSGGLVNHDRLILEFAVQNKDGELIWPREAAAKAGHARRLVGEEIEFRRLLQGFDSDGNPMVRPPYLIDLPVDAMDSTGRWYPVKILAVDIIDEDTSDEEGQFTPRDDQMHGASKRVKVDFSEFGGHVDWIDVESDRLGPAGRFTNETDHQASSKQNGSSQANTDKSKSAIITKKTNSNVSDAGGETSKLCSFPGFGACGLTNLGNTCYMNSALQCISYMPLLRAYLLSSMFKATGDLNRDNPLGTGGKFLEESAELMKIMWCARIGEKSPIRFKSQLGKFNPQFSGADQQDAQEFLNYMLDVLHEDSNRVRKKPFVEALNDEYVRENILNQVGEEAWRRFLRRNRSVVSDVAMGQVLNTVTCPVCNHSSRNFDPFNLLSIPIPTIADVTFRCTLYRRATPISCPWVLNRSRRGASQSTRYSLKSGTNSTSGPPSDTYVAEQYAVTISRLADSGDLRLQLQNLCGIAAVRLHLFRLEEVENDGFESDSVLSRRISLVPLNDKEGPCSQFIKKGGQSDTSAAAVTQIIAFETSLRSRQLLVKQEVLVDGNVDDSEFSTSSTGAHPDLFSKCLESYGDETECRIHDSDPLVLAKEASRRLWPESAKDFIVGLRVDAKDQRGNWFAGSVVEVFDDHTTAGLTDTEAGDVQTRKVSVHFDNFSSKWDETYSIHDFDEGKIQPLFSHATPKTKLTEILVYHRHDTVYFGLPFYVHCQNEWTNARAGAQILAQVSRFLYCPPVDPEEQKGSREAVNPLVERALRESRYYDMIQCMISDLIDLLLDYDRKYVRRGLGLTDNYETAKMSQATRPSTLEHLSDTLATKLADYLSLLPFEIRISSIDPVHSDKNQGLPEEEAFPFLLNRAIGNFVTARSVVVLNWRSQPKETSISSARSVMYSLPPLQTHKASVEILKAASTNGRDGEARKDHIMGSGGVGLGSCLKEFCKEQKLSKSDNWRCPRCRDFREGKQDMNLWRLPDFLTFHIKRFNMSARWREKITTKVNFPLTGLDMSEWCHNSSPALQNHHPDSRVYDLIGVVNHYGSMTGGHYIASCKVSNCGKDGREEVAYSFNGVGVVNIQSDEMDAPSGWRLNRSKAETSQNKQAATVSAKAVAESAEPLWLQFDDELVEPIPPDVVVTETAYVLFYRRRELSSSNIARYSTID